MALPDNIESEEQLEQVLTTPSAALVEFIRTVTGPMLILGAGGKMGPTLAVLAKRAAAAAKHPLEVVAVSRFNEPTARRWLETHEVKTLPADLTRDRDLPGLPDSETILYLVGQKFGTTNNPAATWVINTVAPARVAERFPQARIVALSTGNVYALSEVSRGGSLETDKLSPVGEYANAAVGRERVFEFYSQAHKTRIALLRLFYAVELRYGVLVDIASKVHNGEAIELANGYFNCVWQGDANELALRALGLVNSPASVWNLCRPEIYSVREVANWFGKRFGLSPQFAGVEAKRALLGNPSALCAKLGAPSVPLETMLHWIGDWIARGGRVLGKPTHFEVRDGNY